MSWSVYIIRCADDTLYTGICRDLKRRINEHNHSPKGAKYTRGRRPVKLVHQESFDNRSNACKREYELKQLSKKQKQRLILQ